MYISETNSSHFMMIQNISLLNPNFIFVIKQNGVKNMPLIVTKGKNLITMSDKVLMIESEIVCITQLVI